MKNEYIVSGRKVFIDQEDALSFVGVSLTVGTNGYVRICSRNWKQDRYLHRVITSCPVDMVVDHINGDKLDNRRSNLRVCLHQQNMKNMRFTSRNKTGEVGVVFDKKRLKWAAYISHNNKTTFLGRFDLFEQAVLARKKAELEFHGQYSGSLGVRK